MLMKKIYSSRWALALACILMLSQSCRKDPPIYSPTVYKPTPYKFHGIPDYVTPVNQVIPANNPVTNEGVSLGRMLFFDSTLSKDRTIACASCHYQGYGFTDRGRQFSKGVGDSIGNRNSMALFNVAWERGPFFWDGRASILDSQIVGPVPNVKEMHLAWPDAIARIQSRPEYPPLYQKAFGSGTVTKENTAKAIAQFLRTIVSFNSKYDDVQRGMASFTAAEHRGEQLFNGDPVANTDPNNKKVALGHRLPNTGLDCFHCHAPPLFTPEKFIAENQLLMNDGVGTINVKVPSLRNNGFTAPYMHDGSMPNLDSVIAHYDHGVDPNNPALNKRMYAVLYTDPNSATQLVTPHMELSAQEISDLKAFLNTLNDYTLATNKAYSNPFVH
jgi:cytochrome c peroxidase